MVFSIIVSIVGIFLTLKLKKKVPKRILRILVLLQVIAIFVSTIDFISSLNFSRKIKRPNEYNLKKIVKLNFKVGKIKKDLNINVKGINLKEKDKKELIKRAKKEIDKTILLKNKSVNQIRGNIKLKRYYQKEKVRADWNIKTPIILYTGEVKNGRLKKPKVVNLEVTLSCKGYSEIYSFYVKILPADIKNKDEASKIINETIENIDEKSKDKSYFYLPKIINGERIRWKIESSNKGIVISLMGILILIMYPFIDIEKKKREERNRQENLSKDYPRIVERLSLYVSAGMSTRSAFKEISKMYCNYNIKEKERHVGFNLIYVANKDMENGVHEVEAYRKIGKLSNHKDFRKLSLTLTENVRRGSKRIKELLENEAVYAENKEMNMLKKKGELISTKLMFPLMGMLFVILLILIVPAVTGISI